MINFTLLSKHITIINNNVICYEVTSYLRYFNAEIIMKQLRYTCNYLNKSTVYYSYTFVLIKKYLRFI